MGRRLLYYERECGSLKLCSVSHILSALPTGPKLFIVFALMALNVSYIEIITNLWFTAPGRCSSNWEPHHYGLECTGPADGRPSRRASLQRCLQGRSGCANSWGIAVCWSVHAMRGADCREYNEAVVWSNRWGMNWNDWCVEDTPITGRSRDWWCWKAWVELCGPRGELTELVTWCLTNAAGCLLELVGGRMHLCNSTYLYTISRSIYRRLPMQSDITVLMLGGSICVSINLYPINLIHTLAIVYSMQNLC